MTETANTSFPGQHAVCLFPEGCVHAPRPTREINRGCSEVMSESRGIVIAFRLKSIVPDNDVAGNTAGLLGYVDRFIL